MALSAPQVEHLVAAMLSVNGYAVERAVALMPAFRAEGLLSYKRVAALDAVALARALEAGGYTRGGFVPIMAYRLLTLLQAAESGDLDGCNGHAAAGDRDGFCRVLARVHGFGPRTSATAWALWTAN